MKISTKVILVLISASIVLFGVYGALRVRAEKQTFIRRAKNNTRLLGRTLQSATENALRDHHIENIQKTFEMLTSVEPAVEAIVFNPQLEPMAASKDVIKNNPGFQSVAKLTIEKREEYLQLHPLDDPDSVIIGLPLNSVEGNLAGVLIVNNSLFEMKKTSNSTILEIIKLLTIIIFINTLVIFIFGTFYIRRPLEGLTGAMKKVRSGELQPVHFAQRKDETGMLANEYNHMVEELQKARQLLAEEAEQSRAQQRALQRADKLISIGRLAAGVAHEIGSPLQVLSGRARVMVEENLAPEETKHNAKILVEQIERITRIVEQLLQFARQRPVQKNEISLREVIKPVIDLLGYEARHHGISVTLASDSSVPSVYADPDQIQQVVFNLVSNSILATSEGGRISVNITSGTIKVAEKKEENPSARLIFVDTGKSIPPDILPHIFEPFFTTRAEDGGTGMGLAIVQSIIQEHDGRISVETKAGIGTRFIVDLPACKVPG
ncbi:MAG: ATP-binding protein [bacterium]|nr:ATP-binding protein [bacterium]